MRDQMDQSLRGAAVWETILDGSIYVFRAP